MTVAGSLMYEILPQTFLTGPSAGIRVAPAAWIILASASTSLSVVGLCLYVCIIIGEVGKGSLFRRLLTVKTLGI